MTTSTAAPAPRRGHVILLAGLNLVALGSLTAPAVVGLPRAAAAAVPQADRAGALATILAAGALAALVLNPVFGALSDRTRGRLGRRKPWILGGAVAGIAAIAGLGTATTVPLLLVWWVLAQAAYNAVMAAAAALLADTVPEPRRASASGLFTAAAFIGALPPLVLASVVPEQVALVSLLMPVLALIVCAAALRLPDSEAVPHGTGDAAGVSGRARAGRAFWAVWLQRFVMQIAFGLVTSFTLYLVVDRMTGDAVSATPVTTVATLIGGAGVAAGALWAGAWASRRGRYLPFLVAGAVGIALAGGVRALAIAPAMLWAGAVLGGLAIGCYLSVNLALAMRTLPAGRAGTYLGILNVAETLPGVFVPLLAAGILRVGGGDPLSGASGDYALLYATAGVVALLSLLALPAMRRVARPPATDRQDAATAS